MFNSKLAWVFGHSFLIIAFLFSLFTGLRIAIVSQPELLFLSPFLPQGKMHSVHFLSGFIVAGLFAFFCLVSIQFKSKIKLSLYHIFVKYLGYFLFTISITTGLMKFYNLNSFPLVSALHLYIAYGFLAYLVLHSLVFILQLGIKSINYILNPQTNSILAVLKLSLVLSCLAICLTWLASEQHKILRVSNQAIDTFININGKADEIAWSEAERLTLQGFGGANFDMGRGNTEINVRAINNGVEVFFLIEWRDPTESYQHVPLVKSSKGWQVMQNGFHKFDEQTYYEDKFAVMLSNNCSYGASATTHLGPKPLKDKPANWHGKGYHYSSDASLHDLWHWKAVRTNEMFLADDNYIGKPDIERKGSRRYTAGYSQDGKESGSYVMNWKWYGPQQVEPKRIPIGSSQLGILEKLKLPQFNWTLPWFGVSAYSKEQDNFANGAVIPSVLYRSNQMEGDRADVRAYGTWAKGKWTLEMVRKLSTGSELDVDIQDGVCMWFAAFDSSQIAHTRHARPVKIRLQSRKSGVEL